MTTTVQVNGNQVFINGESLSEVISSAVKQGVKEVLEGKKEDPNETIKVQDLANEFGVHYKTMHKKLVEAGIRITTVGKFTVILKKDKHKIFQP